MKMTLKFWFLCLLLPGFAALDAASAAGPSAGITIGQGWTNETSKPHSVARGFFTIHNAGAAADVLISVACPVAHDTVLQNRRNQDVADIPVGAGESVQLTPGGLHLMMTGTRFKFYPQANIPCSAMFRDAGTLVVYLHVEPAAASSYHSAGVYRADPT